MTTTTTTQDWTFTTIAVDRDYISGADDAVKPTFVCPPKGQAIRCPKIDAQWKDQEGRWYRPAKREDADGRFRMLDDDGNVYFGGWYAAGDAGAGFEDIFEVMLEWGMAWAGCTRIEERHEGMTGWQVVIG